MNQTCENCHYVPKSAASEFCAWSGEDLGGPCGNWALEEEDPIAVLKAEVAALKAERERDVKDWCVLMAAIANLDPSWTEDMGEPDPQDPQFQEEYDPWEGLRLIESDLAAARGANLVLDERVRRERERAGKLAGVLDELEDMALRSAPGDDHICPQYVLFVIQQPLAEYRKGME